MTHRPIRRRFLLCALWSAAASTATGAAAQSNRTRAQLTVDAAPECATEAAIIERVRERSRAISFVQRGGPSLRAAVVNEPDGQVTAQLSLLVDGRRSERRLAAGSCREATDALALLIVLALDPSAASPVPREPPSARDEPEPAAPSRVPPRTPSPPQSTANDPVHVPVPVPALEPTPTTPPPQPEAAASEPVPPEPQPTESPDESTTSWFSITANIQGRGVFGPAPELLPGVGLYVLLGWERDSILSPALGITAAHSWLSGVEESGGRAAFQLQVARLDACVVRVRLGPAAVRGCGSGAIGRLHASGSDTYDPDAHTRLLAVLGGSMLAEIDLGAHFGLHAVASVGAPLVRDSFAFRPRVFHRVSPVLVDLGLGAGVRF